MTKSEVMFQYMPAGNEKDTKGFRSTNPSLGWEWNLALTEHKAKVLTTQLQCSMKFNMVTAWQNALPSVHYRNKVNSQQKAKKHFKTKEWSLCLIKHHVNVKKSLYRPGQALGFQETEAPGFHHNWHMKVVKLSALCTGHFYPPDNIPGTHFC